MTKRPHSPSGGWGRFVFSCAVSRDPGVPSDAADLGQGAQPRSSCARRRHEPVRPSTHAVRLDPPSPGTTLQRMDTGESARTPATPTPGPSLFRSVGEDRKHRCSSSGGYWHDVIHRVGEPSVVPSEEDGVFRRIPGAMKYTLRRQYEALKGKATYGNLSLERREYGHRIGYEILKRSDLLELRLNRDSAQPGVHYSVRLYFAEPPERKDLLLALGATLKPLRDDRGGTQDRHIVGAAQRLDWGRKIDPPWGLSE